MSTTSSSSSTSGGLSELMSGLTRLTGTNLYSGLDTDKIVKALVSGTQSKIDKQGQLEQQAEWRREMIRDVTTSLKSFEDTYFSYTSSDTNILSSTFFNSSKITCSSSAVNATGNSAVAQNIIINSISSEASKAFTSSTEAVSNKTISSTDIYDKWTKSNVGGKALIVTYGGNDYTLALSEDVQLDSEDSTSVGGTKTVNSNEIQKITDGLNDQINSNDKIKGKISFSYDPDSKKIKLTSTDGSPIELKHYAADQNDDSGRKFLSALGFNGDSAGNGSITADTQIDTNVSTSALFNQTIPSSSYVTLDYNGENYTVMLGESIDATGANTTTVANEIQSALSKQIAATNGIKGNVSVNADASGKISFSTSNGTLSLAGGSQNLIQGLGLSSGSDNRSITGSSTDVAKLNESYLGDTLAGSSLTFTLDGVQKTVNFDANDEAQYSTVDDIASYLNGKLKSAFGVDGSNNNLVSAGVVADPNHSGQKELTFTTASNNSVLSMIASDNMNVMGDYGALRIEANETNRPELDKTLSQLAGSNEFSQALKPNGEGNYVININGKNLTFSGDTSLSKVMTTINNDPDTGVNITYSPTSDRFNITAADTGSTGEIGVQDVGGNLASILMGSNYAAQADTRQTITSSAIPGGSITLAQDTTYSFSLDGQAAQKVKITAGTYTLDQLQSQIQSALGNSSPIAVGVDSVNNKLTFQTGTPGSITPSLNISYTGGTDFLGMGNGKTNLHSAADLATLNANNTNNLYTPGNDLKMNVSVDGGKTSSDITRSSNSFSLDGVNLEVTAKTPQTGPITFSVTNNTDDLFKKIKDFVDAYNKIVDKIDGYTSDTPEKTEDHKDKYPPLTDAQKADMSKDEIDKWNTEAKKGLLQNDDDLNTIISDFTDLETSTEQASGFSLASIGITSVQYAYQTNSAGKLQVDDTTLKNALASDPDKVQQLFTNADDGISTLMKKVLDKNVGTFGGDGKLIVRAGTDTTVNDQSDLSKEINNYQSNISKLKDQMQTEEDHWWSKFTAMEQSLSTLNSQYSALMGNSGSSS